MKKKLYDSLVELRSSVFSALGYAPNSLKGSSVTPIEALSSIHELSQPQEVLEFIPEDPLQPYDALARSNISIIPLETRYLNIENETGNRKLAYTISGNANAAKILLCLPGLLETKASFEDLHTYFLQFEDCKVVSVDFPGRGDSESIHESGSYKMSLYLSDIKSLMKGLLSDSLPSTRFTVLGTSMGGVLAMYLTQSFGRKISEVILNDIALTVNWTALYSLYKAMKNEVGFKEIQQLADELSVDERAIADVQLPGHFDLNYRADVWGMNFHEAMDGFAGRVALIYGSESKVCTQQRVSAAKAAIPSLVSLEIQGAGHPVPFTPEVCEFIQIQMKLK